MGVKKTKWFYSDGPEEMRAFEPLVAAQIEDGFQAWWSQGGSGAKFHVEECDWYIDFRLMQMIGAAEGNHGKVARRAVLRAHGPPEGDCGSPEDNHEMISEVEWGHGQDPIHGCGFVPYCPEVCQLLEECFEKYLLGGGLKGIMFTSSNGEDYLVDFEQMRQLRIATRRVRPVYRHAILGESRSAAPYLEDRSVLHGFALAGGVADLQTAKVPQVQSDGLVGGVPRPRLPSRDSQATGSTSSLDNSPVLIVKRPSIRYDPQKLKHVLEAPPAFATAQSCPRPSTKGQAAGCFSKGCFSGLRIGPWCVW